MDAEKKINVHYSSLVGFKAELLRKQAEVKEAKEKASKNVLPINKLKTTDNKTKEKQKKKEKKLEKLEKANEPEDIETMKVHKKSKLMLEAKSRLYEQLSKSHVNMNPNFLVDFEHKPDESDPVQEESKNKPESVQRDDQKEDSDHYSDYDSDSEWVEYTDCFGRTRKCLREDLPEMQKKDDAIKKKIQKPQEELIDKPLYVEDRTPAKEPEIEIMRRKWEEQMEKIANKVDIHYQDILFDEARAHGVGYYAFSQDEEKRAKQQESLMNLRKETEQKQMENQRIHELKEKIQQNRLNAARLRKRIRAGLPAEETEEEIAANALKLEDSEKYQLVPEDEEKEEENNKSKETDGSKKSKIEDASKKKLEDIEKKVNAFGELLGKRNRWYVMSQEEWVDKKRKERSNEFAPAYDDFQYGGSLYFNKSTTNKDLTNNSSDSNDSNIIGPMPPPQNDSTVIGPIALSLDHSNETIGPMPPTMEQIEDSQSSRDSTLNTNVIVGERIEAGLKFLRQKFEEKRS